WTGPSGDAEGGREKTLTRFPSGSLKTMEQFPHGCVVGGITHSTPNAATRRYSASTSVTSKSSTSAPRDLSDCSASSSRYSVNRRLEKPIEAGPAGTST